MIYREEYSNPASPLPSESGDESEEETNETTSTETLPRARPYKKRRRLTEEETKLLMEQFQINPKPTARVRMRLATLIPGTNERTIQIWFQNRRAKQKLSGKQNFSNFYSTSSPNQMHVTHFLEFSMEEGERNQNSPKCRNWKPFTPPTPEKNPKNVMSIQFLVGCN